MRQERREVWVKRIEQWKDSRLTAKEFAAQAGVNLNTLQSWKWRLAADARRSLAIGAQRPGAPADFVEVLHPGVAARAGVATQEVAEPFELLFGNGLRLRVPVTFDAATLHRLLTTLESR
jgi:hypothetical protein